MWEKYLAERVLPGFGVSCKNDRKSLTYGFGGKFLSDAELSHQLTKRECSGPVPSMFSASSRHWVPVVSLVVPGCPSSHS